MSLEISTSARLNNGVDMPLLGFGTARMTGETARRAVDTALHAGYLSIDTSKNYDNEEQVGKAIQNGPVPRQDLFLTTKLEGPDHGHDSTLRALAGSLERLNMPYVDLYLIHAPDRPELRRETWQAMNELVSDGKTRSIGVSNFEIDHLREILSYGGIPPQVNQIELHPFNYHRQKELVDFCTDNNIVITAYSPLGVGQHLDHSKVVEIAKTHEKNPAQVLIRWALQHQFTVIPKSENEEHIQSNLDVFDFQLWEEDMRILDTIGQKVRG
jgi:methylglyoxal/glyoxal reductase